MEEHVHDSQDFTVLDHVMLGSNPTANIRAGRGWPSLAGRLWDVRQERGRRSAWSLACHFRSDQRVGVGTIGWIHRWAGHGFGALEALIVFDSVPRPEREQLTGNEIWYCSGRLRRLSSPVAGERILAEPDWSGAAPYTRRRARQFASGTSVSEEDAQVMARLLDASDRAWLLRKRTTIGRRPFLV